tara:strand:+ start:416 stop:613 length:198 start_codon:yes stop_codon:yes gene_type:complete
LDKADYYRAETVGAPLVDAMHIRMTKRLATFIKVQATIEQVDPSKIARRFLTQSAEEEGYDPNGC